MIFFFLSTYILDRYEVHSTHSCIDIQPCRESMNVVNIHLNQCWYIYNRYIHSSDSTLQTCDNCSAGKGFVGRVHILELVEIDCQLISRPSYPDKNMCIIGYRNHLAVRRRICILPIYNTHYTIYIQYRGNICSYLN